MDQSTAESQTTSLDDQKLTSQISEEELARQNRQEILNKDSDYARTMAMVNDTQTKNKSTLDSLDETIKSLNATLAGVKQTFNAYDNFQAEFGKAMAKLVEKIGATTAPVHSRIPKEGEIENTPKVSNIKDVVQEMKTKSHIVVLTGAGQSVASHIPTFRGEGGYWTLRNEKEKISASTFLTHKYFDKVPEEIWRWHHELRRLVEKNKPNVSHHALADLQMFYKKQNQKFTLITQNVDGYNVDAYHEALAKGQPAKSDSALKYTGTVKPSISMASSVRSSTNIRSTIIKSTPKNLSTKTSSLTSKISTPKKIEEKKEETKKEPAAPLKKFGFCEEVYELHGSINYMRCDKSCTTDLFPAPKVGCADDFVPECPKCKGVARPHTLFFDESYEQEYYSAETILDEIRTGDCLIVIGTALETSLAASIVSQAITNKQLVIEINPQPCIKNGGTVRHLIGGVEKILPELAKALQTKDTTKK